MTKSLKKCLSKLMTVAVFYMLTYRIFKDINEKYTKLWEKLNVLQI